MNQAKLRALSILVLPIVLTISFLVATATLAEGAPVREDGWELQMNHRVANTGTPGGFGVYGSTSAITGSLVISGVTVSDIGATSAAVSWETDAITDGLVRYGMSTDDLKLSSTSPATGTAHSVGLAGLSPDTEYYFEVESGDGVGAPEVDNNSGEYYSFTTSLADLNRKAFVGTVMGEPAEEVTLMQNGKKGKVTIILPEDYILKTPGGPRAGTFEDGARVVVLSQSASEQWVALQVLVKPVKPVMPVVGVVISAGPTSLTMLDHKGNPHFLRLNGEAGSLEEGEVVTLFPGNSGQAKGLVRAEEVRRRMQGFLEETSDVRDTEGGNTDGGVKGKRAEALARWLEKHGAQRVNMLDTALDRVPVDVRKKIGANKARAQRGLESSRAAAGKARGKINSDDSSAGGEDQADIDGEESRDDSVSTGNRGKPSSRGSASSERSDKGQDRGGKPDKKGKPSD